MMRVQAYHPWHHRSGVALPGRALLPPLGMAPRLTQCQVPEERTPAKPSYKVAVHAMSSCAMMCHHVGGVRQLIAIKATWCYDAATAAMCHTASRASHLFKALYSSAQKPLTSQSRDWILKVHFQIYAHLRSINLLHQLT